MRSASFYSKERERDILAAYSLYVDYGHTQENIGKVLNCSKASVSNWVKEIKQSLYKKSVRDGLRDIEDYVRELNTEIKNF
ncbi:hypothetical protein R5L37_06765 [Acinetobacter pittii]|uniref:hypothetical protein n=1 Tax=Acinetobacter pittii TaxID=48296 RepID=UPI002955DF71|nr:hypothetical protein [Acinetobacter pittii]MDV8151470.1 hypothetical protein [Acinetobacter pittii]